MNKFERFWFQPYTPVIFLIVIGFLIYRFVYPSFQHAIGTPTTPLPNLSPTVVPALTHEDTDAKTLEAVGKLLVLPTDEKPQLIPITDIAQYKDQPFFKNAKNGDILIIYAKNKLAILYDPVDNKIIRTAPINLGPTPTTTVNK